MNANEAKLLIEGRLAQAGELFTNNALNYFTDCRICSNQTDSGIEDLLVDGTFAISDLPFAEDGEDNGSTLYFPVTAYLDEEGKADEDKLVAELDRMTEDLKAVAERINAASEEETKKVFCLIFAEAKAKEDSEYRKELDKLNASVKRNLRVALIGAGLLAFISAVLLIIEAIL